jgi:signal transduction histidine kinase
MDKRDLLLRLCEELTQAVDYLYGEDVELKGYLGEVLATYGSVLLNIGWTLTWASKELQDKVFEIIEDAFRKQEEHRLKCRLEEWLRWKISDVVAEALQDEEGQKETEQTQIIEELPF